MNTDTRGGSNQKYFNKGFFKKWSPSMAYVLGYIFADGALEDVRKSSRTCYFSISSIDISILKKIRNALSSEHNIYTKRAKDTLFSDGRVYKCKKAYILRIGSKSVFQDLVSLGVTQRKSLNMNFPSVSKKTSSIFY